MPSNNLPERFYMGARTTESKGQGRPEQTSCMNMHKAYLGSQLSIFYTVSFAWAHPLQNKLTWTPSNDPPKRVDTDAFKRPTQTILLGHPRPTSPNNFAQTPSPDLHERVCTDALARPT